MIKKDPKQESRIKHQVSQFWCVYSRKNRGACAGRTVKEQNQLYKRTFCFGAGGETAEEGRGYSLGCASGTEISSVIFLLDNLSPLLCFFESMFVVECIFPE